MKGLLCQIIFKLHKNPLSVCFKCFVKSEIIKYSRKHQFEKQKSFKTNFIHNANPGDRSWQKNMALYLSNTDIY